MADAARRSGPSIAVVGLACRFPDAADPAELLDMALTGRRAFRRIPPGRFSLADYYQADQARSDATYSTRAALIEGWRFDCTAFGVEPAVYAASDPAHWLALETTARALAMAGLPAGVGLNRDRTAVIIGNTLAGDTSRANGLRLRWPYVRRVLTEALHAAEVESRRADAVLRQAEHRYLAPFPAMGPYTLAGSMPATIAAAISAYFGFRGGSHTVDSACSSSLQAVTSACLSLTAGELDAAVVGGVDLSLDPLELIGLAQARMLATTDVRLYDQSPSGYLPGEGCGVLVLMRTADARAADYPVYAEIAGWGTSSGGLPGEPRSQASSQLLAMRRAYDRAGVDPADIGYIEGNGAATLADDAAELGALASLRSGSRKQAALGSVKANIGHAGAAAGAAGLIKTVLAVSSGVVPPTTGADKPHDLIVGGDAAVTLPDAPQEWPATRRLAAVSATGIGGSNVHLVVRHDVNGRARMPRWTRPASMEPDAIEPKLSRAAEPLLFLLHAPDRAALAASLSRLADRAGWLSDAELLDLSCALGRDPTPQGQTRVALVASQQDELAALTRRAVTMLPDLADGLIAATPGVFASEAADGRVTLLLSGTEPRGLADGAADALRRDVQHSLDTLRWLDSLDVTATAAVGHGLGLLTGLAWAGVLGEREVVEIADLRARFLTMAAAGAPKQTRAADEDASWPPPTRGDAAELHRVIAQRFRFGPPRRRLISTVTGAEIESVEDAIDLICRGFTGTGQIATAVATGAIGATLMLETGPAQTLADAAAKSSVPAVSLRSGLADHAVTATVAAALFAVGALGDPQPLFAGWQTRPIDIGREHAFLASPCEAAPRTRRSSASAAMSRRADEADARTISPIPVASRPGDAPAPDGHRDQAPGSPGVRAVRQLRPVAGLQPWARCFTESLRPARPAAGAPPARSWRVFAAARSPWLADLGGRFTADPAARRTLAVVEDPADDLALVTALAAARDAVSTGEVVVLTASPAFTAFFATLHAEHPSVGVTVLRVSPEAASTAAILPFASAVPGRFRELIITPEGTANEPVLTAVPLSGGRGLPLGPADTMMISRATGGAGLVLAQVLACAGTGIVVVGRADSTEDTRLIAGLEELRSAGARIGYEVIDIADAASLAGAVRRIEKRIGPVTAIAHAARQTEPVPIVDISDEDIRSHAAGPAGALGKLADVVGAGQLKLLISVGTIASRYGFAGAGVHTLGSDALASRAAEIAATRPGCEHLHLDMPAWNIGGLGEQPDLMRRLAAADAPPIGPAAASRLLLRALGTPGLPASLAVHGRVGGLASRPAPMVSGAELAAAGMPGGGRFLREVAVHYPGIELICTARLSLASDPYLADYQIDGLPVLPPVLALEALAQAASVLAGRPVRQATGVRFEAPVLIPLHSDTVLRICAQRDGDVVTAVLRSSETSFGVDHAAALFSCDPPEMPDSPVAVASSAVPPLVSAAATGLVDGAEMYGPVFFQSGRFRRIALLPEVTPRSGRAIARGADEQPWFAPGGVLGSTTFLLGSPGLNDAVLQVLQTCVPHRMVRPVSCESVQFAGREVTGPVEIRAIASPVRHGPAGRSEAAPGQPGAPDIQQADGIALADEADRADQLPGNATAAARRGGGTMRVPLADLMSGQPGAAKRPRHARKVRAGRSGELNGQIDGGQGSPSPGAHASGQSGSRVRPMRADSVPGGRQLWSVEAVNAAGQLLAAWRGIKLADAGPQPRNPAWPPALLSVFLERCATDLGLDAGLRVTIASGAPDLQLAGIPRQSERPGNGRPGPGGTPAAGRHAGSERRGLYTVTAPGTGQLSGLILTARSPTPVACAWACVGNAGQLAQSGAGPAIARGPLDADFGEAPAVTEARLHVVRACLAAADLQADSDLRVSQATSDGWAALSSRRARIASTVVEVSGVPAPVAIALLTTRRAHARAPVASLPATVPP